MDNIWMWFSLFLVGVIFFLWRRIRWLHMDMERVERAKSNLNDELVRLEYLQLSQQIQPHFLFNGFNLLLSLARLDRKEELLNALENLSLFLRSGYTTRPAEVEIGRELEMTDYYLAIQQMRFGKRLTLQIHCSEKCKKRKTIPYLLQTFVENAFKHGLEKRVGPVELEITFEELTDQTRLIVRDNGTGEKTATDKSGGAGLQNLRRRLNLLFGAAAGIELDRTGDYTSAIAWWPTEGTLKKGKKGEI